MCHRLVATLAVHYFCYSPVPPKVTLTLATKTSNKGLSHVMSGTEQSSAAGRDLSSSLGVLSIDLHPPRHGGVYFVVERLHLGGGASVSLLWSIMSECRIRSIFIRLPIRRVRV